jgi:hypothetical protein
MLFLANFLSTLMMEAIRSIEMFVLTRARRRHIPEDGVLHSHLRDNLKSYTTKEHSIYSITQVSDVLVMPIRCVQTLKDLDNDEKKDLLMVLKKVHEVVRTVNKSSGVTTGIQTGASAGQTVKVREYMDSVFLIRQKNKIDL